MRAGRSEEQREQLMLTINDDVSRISGIPAENVWINLCNLAPTDMVEYGRVLPKPGEEAAMVRVATTPSQKASRKPWYPPRELSALIIPLPGFELPKR